MTAPSLTLTLQKHCVASVKAAAKSPCFPTLRRPAQTISSASRSLASARNTSMRWSRPATPPKRRSAPAPSALASVPAPRSTSPASPATTMASATLASRLRGPMKPKASSSPPARNLTATGANKSATLPPQPNAASRLPSATRTSRCSRPKASAPPPAPSLLSWNAKAPCSAISASHTLISIVPRWPHSAIRLP